MPQSRKLTSAHKTATSVVLGNDYLPKKTTYQCTHVKFHTPEPKTNAGIALSEVLPKEVYPAPNVSLRIIL